MRRVLRAPWAALCCGGSRGGGPGRRVLQEVWRRSSRHEVLLRTKLLSVWRSTAGKCGTIRFAPLAWALSGVPASRAFFGEELFRAKALPRPSWSVLMMAASTDVVSLLEAPSWTFSSLEFGSGSPGENPSFEYSKRATMASTSPPSCGCRLGEPAQAVVCGFSFVGVGGRRGSGPGRWLCVEAAASGSMVGNNLLGCGSCLRGLGGTLVSPVQRGCRLGRRALVKAV